jgi:hypothetical protein
MIDEGGRALDGLGVRKFYRIQLNSEFSQSQCGSKTTGAKLRGRKGNNPDRQLRSLNAS